jgi:hypothetical protein
VESLDFSRMVRIGKEISRTKPPHNRITRTALMQLNVAGSDWVILLVNSNWMAHSAEKPTEFIYLSIYGSDRVQQMQLSCS